MLESAHHLYGLWPPFAEAVRYLVAWSEYYGYSGLIVSSYRSFEEQAQLAMKGRTPAEYANRVKKRGAGGTVTDAWPGESAHNYGLAIDVDGRNQREIVALARQLGFGTVSWDPAHIEWPGWQNLIR